MIIINMFLAFILFIIVFAIYITLVSCISIALSNLNFYIYKRRCNKYLELAMQGEFYKEEFLKWFEVEEKMYKIRRKKIIIFHDVLLLEEREK